MGYKYVDGKMVKTENPKKPTRQNMAAYQNRIAELEAALDERDKYIADLEAAAKKK